MIYPVCALIAGGVVKELIIGEYSEASTVAKARYGRSAIAVDVSQTIEAEIAIGDHYEGGIFTRLNPDSGEWEEVPQTPSEKERITSLEAASDDVMIALAELYEMIVGEE